MNEDVKHDLDGRSFMNSAGETITLILDDTWTQEPLIYEDIQPDHIVEG